VTVERAPRNASRYTLLFGIAAVTAIAAIVSRLP
jgi:hypothetical protein